MNHPACFTEFEYAGWLQSARSANFAESPCDDCTGAYAQKMRNEKRCAMAEVQVLFRHHPHSNYVKKNQAQAPANIAQAATN